MIGRNRVLTHCVKILIRPSLIALLIKENSESYIVLFKISADWAGILYRDKVICFRFVRRYSITCILILFMTNIKIRMYDNTWFSSLLYMTWCSRLVYRLGKHTLAKIKIDLKIESLVCKKFSSSRLFKQCTIFNPSFYFDASNSPKLHCFEKTHTRH